MSNYRLPLFLISWVTLVDAFFQGFTDTLFPYFKETFFLSDTQLGFLAAVFYASVFFAIPLGLLIDKRRQDTAKFIIMGSVSELISLIFYLIPAGFYSLLLAKFMHSIGSMIFWVAGLSWIARLSQDQIPSANNKAGRSIGIIMGAMGVGALLGPLLGSILFQYVSLTLPFVLIGALLTAAVVTSLFIEGQRYIPPLQVEKFPLSNNLGLTEGRVLIAWIFVFLGSMQFGIFEPFFPVFVVEQHHFSLVMVGLLFSAMMLFFSIFTLIAGFAVDRSPQNRKRVPLLGLYLAGLGLISMVLANNFWIFVAGVVIAIGLACYYTPGFSNLIESHVNRPGPYGYRYAVSFIAASLGYIVGSLGGGGLRVYLSFENIFYLQAALLLSVAIVLTIFNQKSLGLKTIP